MRTALFLLLGLSLQAQQAAIQGIALNSITNEPVPGVHITAFVLRESEPEEIYGAISQRDGHFSISGLKPATYIMLAQKNGFVYVPDKEAGWAGIGVALKPSEQRTGVTVKITPQAVISGRVTDEFGDPVRGLQVDTTNASAATPEALVSGPGNVRTDERGRFRIVAAPGKYYVNVTPSQQDFSMGLPEVRTDGSEPAVYAITWYPSATGKQRATMVEALPGRESTGIDIALARQRNLSVSGIITGLPATANNAVVYLVSAIDPGQPNTNLRTAMAGKDGKFAISGVTPGSYRIWSMAFENGAISLRTPFSDLHVENSEQNVSLNLLPGEELSGAVVIEHDPPGTPAEKRTISLEPVSQLERFGRSQVPSPVDIEKDGAFKLAKVFPGKLRVHVAPLPENAYIKSVRVDNAEMPGDVLDLSRGVQGSRVRVTISRNGASLEGAVTESDGQPQRAAILFVGLVADPKEISYESLRRTSPEKKFSFTGVRPGKYRLVVIDPLLVPNVMSGVDDAFSQGTEIELHEGDRLTKDIKLPAKGKPDAK